ncbi:MAG: hypothetical protein A2176_06795 [Spirochaetes bacterium RBG_13_51_14]|nr:MAG: hypothetical protein A2176_06795 [Spirochaetes bacterium RBG_13_51_14]
MNDREVNAMMQEEINRLMKNYARVEQIRRFTLLDAEWTQATGEITPSLKIKRRVVESKYKDNIEALCPVDAKD